MIKKIIKNLILMPVILAFSIGLISSTGFCGYVSLVTYYPAPQGAFNLIRLTPRDPIEVLCDNTKEGLMFYNNDPALNVISICSQGSFSRTLGAGLWSEITYDGGDADVYFKDPTLLTSAKVGIGTTEAEFKLSILSDGGILSNGKYDPIDTGLSDLFSSGSGSKFIWYPKKSAFRVGTVTGSQWNDVNIGDYSVALGNDTKAVADKSIIIGLNATVTGSNSVFISLSDVKTNYEITRDNIMSFEGGRVAIGDVESEFELTVDGGIIAKGAADIGSGNNLIQSGSGCRFIWYPRKATFRAGCADAEEGFNDSNTGNISINLGNNNSVIQDYSIALGQNNSSNNLENIAIGIDNIVSADTAIAIGNANTVMGNNSIALGLCNSVSGNNSINLRTTDAAGCSSVANNLGDNNILAGVKVIGSDASQGIVLGSNSFAFWPGPGIAIGSDINAGLSQDMGLKRFYGNKAIAVGLNSKSYGDSTISVGFDNSVSGIENIVIGIRNTSGFQLQDDVLNPVNGMTAFYDNAAKNNVTIGNENTSSMWKGDISPLAAVHENVLIGYNNYLNSGFNNNVIGFSNSVQAYNSYLNIIGRENSIGVSNSSSKYSVIGNNNNLLGVGERHIYVIGSQNTSNGSFNQIVGNFNNVNSMNSSIVGNFNNVTANNSVTIGRNLVNRSYGSVTMGMFNSGFGNAVVSVPTDPIFVVGSGPDNSNRRNSLVILKNGNVGINTNTPALRLFVNGTSSGQVAWNPPSDIRLKTNIKPLEDSLNKMKQLKPVKFDYSDQQKDKKNIGYLAQDLVEIVPEAVAKDGEYYGVYYEQMVVVLTDALRSVYKEKEQIKQDLENLKTKFEDIKQRQNK